jgi:fumarate hydratase class I
VCYTSTAYFRVSMKVMGKKRNTRQIKQTIAVGGAAYLISKAIHSARVFAFADPGMEVVYEFEVKNMPVTVAVDSLGSSVHTTGPAEWQSRIAQHLPNTAILQ